MKKIFIFLICLIMISCGCGHKEGEHVPNDTILCVVDKKSRDASYNIVLKIMRIEHNVKFRNLETGNTTTINKKIFYNMFEEGDTIYEIIQHCPRYKVELKKK